MPHNLFKQIDVHINDVSVVDQSTSTYPWKAFFTNFLYALSTRGSTS